MKVDFYKTLFHIHIQELYFYDTENRRKFLFSRKGATYIKSLAHHTARALWLETSPLIGAEIEFLQQKEKTE
jgi:hypothetical protein